MPSVGRPVSRSSFAACAPDLVGARRGPPHRTTPSDRAIEHLPIRGHWTAGQWNQAGYLGKIATSSVRDEIPSFPKM